jgi:hypothetical protein
MKNVKNIVVALALCVGFALNACQLTMTNDGKTALLVRDKNAPEVGLYIAPGQTKLTMDLTGDDSTLEFFVEGKKKGRYVKKYTLSILRCSLIPEDNVMGFSRVISFVKKPTERFVTKVQNLDNYALAMRVAMEFTRMECLGMKGLAAVKKA